MLKRYQVLISDWMEDYIKLVADKYDLSSSAVIRVHLSLAILFVISSLHPEYKPNLTKKELEEISGNASKDALEEDGIHQVLSKILFEARKAVEYRLAQEKKLKK